MRYQKILTLFIAMFGATSIFAETTETKTSLTEEAKNTISQFLTSSEQQSKRSAGEWGLSEDEWSRYQKIMKEGSRGIWSPNLDPLTTLGIEASSDAERMKYARLLARKEYERVEKELRFQLTYDAVFKELYPNITPIRADTDTTTSTNTLNNTSGRLLFFTRTDNCPKCETALNKLLTSNRKVDIYLIDSEGNNNKIQDWAVTHHIDVNKVRNRQITLNHDNGLWLNYANGKMPAVFQIQGDGQWQAFAY
ncbi:TIGR03759 family integrating conjugative element protein [Aggregatibacter actinomycetemcomitans]|uniref:TIGR03759 family integrating conjugative element protein n=1 Tax=Aggregatibacter actinomycetemcomitans TaxID=714 RepID=UPI00197BED66|nr:TIGR03759 family integrating conjugative element protein [Aggregatibacter actinomycetemcomitans]MBN6079258.1 TIGR03759 family integrating conjugative element protein [Aggregatibacter actinomycetemcomitans]